MNAFLSSIKSDLLGVRLRLAVFVLAFALVAAVVYAVQGGGGSSATTPVAATPAPAAAAGIPVSVAPTNPDLQSAETTEGIPHQRGGSSRDPFSPLSGSTPASGKPATSTPTTSSKTSSSTTSASGTSSTPSTGGAAPITRTEASEPAEEPAKKTTPKTIYHVAVLFGVAPPGTPPASLQLTPYENLELLTPLPSSSQPLLVFRGVTTAGKSATFSVVGEVILRGNAACMPSTSQCQAIDLKPGESEELEYLPPVGSAITYKLQVVSISSTKATAATAARVLHTESKAGKELLIRKGLTVLPWLHYVPQQGVLVFATHPASAARAHAAA